MAEEKLKLAVFIDFDNIQIGVKDTLGKEFDVALVLEALKERGEVVAKIAYGDWARAGEHSRQMTQHAIQMVQRNVTPRGDKNGADINLALDAFEMAFTRHHINAFVIVGGDSDFMALVEKLKQYDKQVFVVGGRSFTSNILQKNCTEFVSYENLLKSSSDSSRAVRASRRGDSGARSSLETRALAEALPNIQRALKVLADRGVAPQIGLLKSTLLQLDSTFSERDYGAASFLEFMQKVERTGHAHLHRTERGYLVEPADTGAPLASGETGLVSGEASEGTPESETATPASPDPAALELLKAALETAGEKSPGRPLYLRQVRQRLRLQDPGFDERRYGYRGTLELLEYAQREGWLKLHRDRQGVWRIHPTLVSAAPPAPGTVDSEAELGAPVSILESATPAPSDALAEPASPSPSALDQFTLELPGPSAVPESEPLSEPAPDRKARKPRPSRAAGRGTKRRPATRSRSTQPRQD